MSFNLAMNSLLSQNESFLSDKYFFVTFGLAYFDMCRLLCKDALYDVTPNFARLFETALEKRTLLIYIHIERVPAILKQ